jgi:hypothetical protein
MQTFVDKHHMLNTPTPGYFPQKDGNMERAIGVPKGRVQ